MVWAWKARHGRHGMEGMEDMEDMAAAQWRRKASETGRIGVTRCRRRSRDQIGMRSVVGRRCCCTAGGRRCPGREGRRRSRESRYRRVVWSEDDPKRKTMLRRGLVEVLMKEWRASHLAKPVNATTSPADARRLLVRGWPSGVVN